ncbi:MAG: Wzz/FepE/Etk N-terminal domain-containing protein [Bacteroidales bacterium]|nr:Wzz/FepE/Etk N-terminal domain-containing protein [Bacteroidales bacterium]MDD4673398.1 Wzz/FepE/Etk N-terminal domain-containing protein [Bacteroidales bacterium]MDY0349541.1 Wzz/FepE/Etk N-terminal domain-containing protein [Tenuifilaceae bacterium]
MEKELPDFNLNGTNLLQMIWQRRFVFMLIGAIAFVVSIVVSLLITPQFKSSAILIPSTATQASKDAFVASRARGLTVFGDDEEVEHLIQILSSETLRRHIVNEFNLFEYYGVNPADKHAWYKVNRIYSGNVSFMPSRYRSVRIEVLDDNPQMAAKLANAIVVTADSLTREAKRLVAQKALEVLEFHYQQLLDDAYSLDDSMTTVMAHGVINLPYQAKEATRVYTEALAAANKAPADRVVKYINKLALQGAKYTRYFNDIQYKSLQIKDLQENLHILRAEAQGLIPSQFVIDWAYPSDKKAKPKKLVIVIASTLSALFFSLFLFILLDFFRKSIKPQKVA